MSRERFKLGFLKKCASLGMSPAEARTAALSALSLVTQLLEKRAEGALGDLWNVAKGIGTVGLVAPPILGGIAGYGAGRLADVGDMDVEEAKTREKIDELQRLAIKARHNRAMQLATQSLPPPRPMF